MLLMRFRTESRRFVFEDAAGRPSFPYNCASPQCLTLAPVVALKAEVASQEDKEYLAQALFHLREPSTGTLEGDVRRLSTLIQG